MTKDRAGAESPSAATMADVARRAGVSTATVSRVLANPDKVARATRERVLRLIQHIGYIPNLTARNLRVQSTKMVLALVPSMVSGFFPPILGAIEDELGLAGYGLLIGDTRHQTGKEIHYSRLIQSRQVDGVILLTGRLPRSADGRAIDVGVPVVLVCNDVNGLALPLFAADNRRAAYRMTEYLIGMGHRQIAHIMGPVATASDAKERMAGFAEAMAHADFPMPRRHLWQGDFYAPSGRRAAEKYLSIKDRPTAVFAANDEMAISFVQAVSAKGISVPHDVSVAGFDDIENLGLFIPAITTMRQPRSEMGRLAAQELLRRMSGNLAHPPSRVGLECELIVRDSVRAVRHPGQTKPSAKIAYS